MGTVKETLPNAYRVEFEKKLRDLSIPTGLLYPDNVSKMLDEEATKYDPSEARTSPAGMATFGGDPCNDIVMRNAQIKQFARARYAKV